VKNGKQASQGVLQIKFGNLNIFIKKSNMVQPKYSPEEALQRVKLMMGYDLKKTLKENIKEIGVVLNEQSSEQISYAQLGQDAKDLRNYLTGDVQTSDLENIQTTLNDVYGKSSEDGSCALTKLIAYYSKIVGNGSWRDFFTTTAGLTLGFSEWGRTDLINDITKSQEMFEGEFEDVKKTLLNSINKELNGFCKTGGKKEDELKKDEDCAKNPNQEKCKKTDDSKKKTSGYTLCTGTYKYACKTDPSDAIGKVQSCLGGLIVDGKFGPKTRDKLSAKGFTTFTDSDIEKICQTEVKPEVGGEVQTVSATSTDF